MKKIIINIARFGAAAILLQTLFFKFTAAPESVYIFSTLGIEPFGRIGSGIAELIAAILLLWPSKSLIGAILSAGVMAGAIASHVLFLGYEIMGDGGLLFSLAAIVLILNLTIILYNFQKLISVNLTKPFTLINQLSL
ncbi:MAG: DoxX family protein [Bacteroidia bacterium]|nr:DoxX family protein [Bacteroidia bacterium]